MEDTKLVVSPKKYNAESQVLSVRMPKDMLQEIDTVSQKTGRTRNELILTCIEFALEHMEIEEN